MAQQTALQQLIEWAISLKYNSQQCIDWICIKEKAEEFLQMEKEQNDKWNEFLDAEKVLGISDVKTIERIQWFYNTYFNKTFGKS